MLTYLKLNNIKKNSNKKTIIDNISLKLNSGEIIGILGPNGAGKTTLFNIIIGITNNDKGHIFINKKNITKLPIHKRAKLGINFLPQISSIFEELTVKDNIKSILEIQYNTNKKSEVYILNKLLYDFNIYHLKNIKGKNLSGGEKKKVEIARCLTTNPLFILLDEPFAGMDPISIKEIKKIIMYLSYLNIGILITDHNFLEILKICDKSYILINGQIVYTGSKYNILKNNQIKKEYLG